MGHNKFIKKPWTEDEEKIMLHQYKTMTPNEMAIKLNRNKNSIFNKARRLGLQEKPMGEKHPLWKRDSISYQGLHQWVGRHKPKPLFCEKCHKNKPYDLANISGDYKRDINDFEWLCRKCHMNSDGRLKNLKQYTLKSKLTLPEYK